MAGLLPVTAAARPALGKGSDMTTTPQRRYLSGVEEPQPAARTPTPLPSPPPSSVIAWAWYVDGVRRPAEDLTTAARLACAGEGFVWLGLKDPTDADLAALASQFNLHPLAIEDAAHGHTRSKLEMFGEDLFMVISTVAYVEHEKLTETSEIVTTGQVMIFLGHHFVITVRRGEHAQLSSLRRALENDPERLARGPAEVLYAIADKIIDDYLGVVAEFETDVDEIETRVFARGGTHEVDQVYQLKRELIEFKRCVLPLGAPLLRLATRDLPVIPHEAKAYFRELADHHTEAREAVASFDEVLASILQAGLARASVADNEDVRKISAWVAIVAVPTMVAGIYGMNFDNMPELRWQLRLLRGARRDRAIMVGSTSASNATGGCSRRGRTRPTCAEGREDGIGMSEPYAVAGPERESTRRAAAEGHVGSMFPLADDTSDGTVDAPDEPVKTCGVCGVDEGQPHIAQLHR